ncbi:hypothetical protein Poli38472_012364 [Pythium oligandrum]|uniref:Uncharacterized protein n=1 Tax=Pythium oligandrum TaxID=41045 RepID=A0A8K1CQQ8_PYTOL|nr:hypothetical protein Poli38472_012364 [Pythium oligandrum]|eukprot:TMW67248.1 hypothetical protein Poli38472_012364 [Pythium oligandrum]
MGIGKMKSHRTSSESDNDSVHLVAPRPLKKRRNTYDSRKDEVLALRKEAEYLTLKLKQIQCAMLPGMLRLQASLHQNMMLKLQIKEMNEALGAAQCMFANDQMLRNRNPLNSFIHLPADSMERRQLLLSMKEQKLFAAKRFVEERISGLDLYRSRQQSESYDTEEGDRILVQCDVIPFHGATSVKQVYDESLVALGLMEFSLWEHLGVTAISESDDFSDHVPVSQHRVLSTTVDGIDVEKNMTTFKSFVEADPESDASSYGLITLDSVDQDDLYPYQTHTRVRKDLSAVVLICRSPPKPGREPTVSVVRYGYARLHQSQCGLATDKESRLIESMPRWGEVIRSVLNEYVSNRLQYPQMSPISSS